MMWAIPLKNGISYGLRVALNSGCFLRFIRNLFYIFKEPWPYEIVSSVPIREAESPAHAGYVREYFPARLYFTSTPEKKKANSLIPNHRIAVTFIST